jgi:hypothetical protein
VTHALTRAPPRPSRAPPAHRAHQAAEKRRRNRINDRLQALREVVPVATSANTGEFLQELLAYVTQLQELAGVRPKQPLPLSVPGAGSVGLGGAGALGPLAGAAAGQSDEEELVSAGDASAGASDDSGRAGGASARKRRRTPPEASG